MMIMKMDAGLDTGPVALAERVAIDRSMTSGELHDRLMTVGAGLMVEALAKLEAGALALVPQAAEGVTYARKIDKAETRIDWRRPAAAVHNHIRGLSPFPGAWCEIEIGGKMERLKVLRSAPVDERGCGNAARRRADGCLRRRRDQAPRSAAGRRQTGDRTGIPARRQTRKGMRLR